MSSIAERFGTRSDGRPDALPPEAETATETDAAAAELLAAVAAEERIQLSWALSPNAPEGEEVVRKSLSILDAYGWVTLRRVIWPAARPTAVLHVAVGPGGVVVVDEELWTGSVRVEGEALRHDGFRCDRVLKDLAYVMGTISALLPPEHRTAVSGAICVTPRDMEPEPVAGVQLVGRLHLATLLASMPARLTQQEVTDITGRLHQALGGLADAVPPAAADVPVTTPWPAQRAAAPGGAPRSAQPDAAWLPSEAPSGTRYLPVELGTTDTAAYFGSRQHQASGWTGPSAAPEVSYRSAGRRMRTEAGRVTLALLVGLLTYQNSDAVVTAVDSWMGSDVGATVAAQR